MTHRRRCEYRLYPSPAQQRALRRQSDVCREVLNWALTVNRTRFQEAASSLSYAELCRLLTQERVGRVNWGSVHTHPLQTMLKRLDRLFQAFFRRNAEGKKPGFPSFRAKDSLPSIGYREHGNGWRIEPGAKGVRLFGIGRVRIRGKARFDTTNPKTCEVLIRAGRLYLSVAYSVEHLPQNPVVHPGTCRLSIAESEAVLVESTCGVSELVVAPRHAKRTEAWLRRQKRQVLNAKPGSRRRDKRRGAVRRSLRRLRNQCLDLTHKTARRLVGVNGTIEIDVPASPQIRLNGNLDRFIARELVVSVRSKAAEVGCLIVDDAAVRAGVSNFPSSERRTRMGTVQRDAPSPESVSAREAATPRESCGPSAVHYFNSLHRRMAVGRLKPPGPIPARPGT